MGLKPFRDYSEHDVVNLYKLNAATGERGLFVTPLSYASNNDPFGWASETLSSYGNTQSMRFTVAPTVKVCASGEYPLGVMLYNVQENDENGLPLAFGNYDKKKAMAVVCSGEAVPILRKGLICTNFIENKGAVGAGSGVAIGVSGLGWVRPIGRNDTTGRIGTFLSDVATTGEYNGFARVSINIA